MSSRRISGAATVLDGLVYFSTLSGRTYALGGRSARLVWSTADGKYSPVVDDGVRVYLVGYGRLQALIPVRRASATSRSRLNSATASIPTRAPARKDW
ncbi:MAG: hypothetical protein ABSB96_05800 [Gaiellaceae bacterium]